MTKCGKSEEKQVGGWKMAVLYWDENDPLTELGKSKEKKVWIQKKKRGKRWAWIRVDVHVEGFSRQWQLGWEFRIEVWAGNTHEEVIRAVVTVEAMLRWPHLTTEACSKVQAIVTFSLNMEFSQKIHKDDDASHEKCCFPLCVFPSSLLRNFFSFVIPSRKAACTVEGHSNESFLNFHYHLFWRVFHNKIIFLRISEKLLMYPTSRGLRLGRELRGHHYLPHFTDDATAAQTGQRTCPIFYT